MTEEPGLVFELGDDALARFVAVETGEGAGVGVDVRGLVHDVDGGQCDVGRGEVIGIVGGRDLDRAGAEVRTDPVVGDDRDLAPDEWHAQLRPAGAGSARRWG